jgi:hypothetical protein
MARPHEDLTGGCACGSIRYRLKSLPFDAGYCHCRICQLSSGAPVMAFATVPRDDLVMLGHEPVRRASSDLGERWFCGDCGTPIAMRVGHQPDTTDFTIATLDDPECVAPGFHIWTRSRIGWFDTDDTLERHERFRPETVGLDDRIAAGAEQTGPNAKASGAEETAGRGSHREGALPLPKDARTDDPGDAERRIALGEIKESDINPLAPPVNVGAGS